MLPDEKNITQQAQSVKQQVIDISNITDFNSAAVKEQMREVQQEVKSVLDGAMIDSSKLSLNFTV